MTIPFSREQFFDVMARYNESVWPAQAILYVLALAAIVLALRRSRNASRAVHLLLAILWLWTAVVYDLGFFLTINPLALVFAGMFLLQALFFISSGIRRGAPVYSPRSDFRGWSGGVLILFALVLYPVSSALEGHHYPHQPTLGLPCPTTIFTLGMLIWAQSTMPRIAFIIPLAWAGIGTMAALQLGVAEDLSLAGTLIVLALTAVMAKPLRSSGSVLGMTWR